MKKIGLWIVGMVLFLLLLAVGFYQLYFLRDPIRAVPNDDSLFVAPANGNVIAVLKYDDQLKDTLLYKKNNVVIEDWTSGFSSGATLISIMMTPMDVHYQKAPLASQLLSKSYKSGSFLNVMKADPLLTQTFQNEHNSLLFQTPEGYQFRIIQIAGALARRIVDYVQPDQQVQQGEKI